MIKFRGDVSGVYFVMSEIVPLARNMREAGRFRRASDPGVRPAWTTALLASVLIFITVVDLLGNFLVIISVFRNRKLRNV
ncbi:melatonin receptor type 1B-B, partial [Clarias magur]